MNALAADLTAKKKNEHGITEKLNPDMEVFLKRNAFRFAREKKSITYLVCDEDDGLSCRMSGNAPRPAGRAGT